jgi:hypothetical protein
MIIFSRWKNELLDIVVFFFYQFARATKLEARNELACGVKGVLFSGREGGLPVAAEHVVLSEFDNFRGADML